MPYSFFIVVALCMCMALPGCKATSSRSRLAHTMVVGKNESDIAAARATQAALDARPSSRGEGYPQKPAAGMQEGAPLDGPARDPSSNASSSKAPQSDQTTVQPQIPSRPVLYEQPTARGKYRAALIYLHEAGSSPEEAARRHGLLAAARDAGVLLVLPQGSGPSGALSWNAGPCCGQAAAKSSPDLPWLGQLIQSLPRTHQIDPKHIYIAGQGNGGMLAYRAACEFSSSLAGVAVVGSGFDSPDCRPGAPIPVLHVHSMEDARWPYFGGNVKTPLEAGLHQVAPAIKSVTYWALVNGCTQQYRRFTQGSAIWEAFEQCAPGGQVTLLSLAGAAGTKENPYARYPVGFKILEFFDLTKEWGTSKKNTLDALPGIR